MNTPNSYNSCEQVKSHFTLYPLLHAALLWCGSPPNQVNSHAEKATQIIPGVFLLPYMTCLEPRCRLINDAIDRGVLPVCREKGYPVDDHVAPARRHLRGQDLREWIAKEHPNDKPAFLFDEIERKVHSAISAEAYRALEVDRDAARTELKRSKVLVQELAKERDGLLAETAALKACIEKMTPAPRELGDRAETTLLNIIGGLLDLMLGKSPAGRQQSVFDNQSAIISTLLGHYEGKPGIAARTLEEKFAAAKRSLASS
ncbi:hypothetical protein [Methylobacter sp.]